MNKPQLKTRMYYNWREIRSYMESLGVDLQELEEEICRNNEIGYGAYVYISNDTVDTSLVTIGKSEPYYTSRMKRVGDALEQLKKVQDQFGTEEFTVWYE